MTMTTIPAHGWTLLVERFRLERRAGKRFSRTIGRYTVFHDGQPVAALSGFTVEREGPGDNGPVGKTDHRCIEAGTYPVAMHDTENYSTTDYESDGDHPRPAFLLAGTADRTAILVHPASGYGSTIGCINLCDQLDGAASELSLADSTERVIALIDDLKSYSSGRFPPAIFLDARVIVVDGTLDVQGQQALRLGSRGPLVLAWQGFLRQRGLDPGAADGRFGAATQRATIAFQASQSLVLDGAVGPETMRLARQLGFHADRGLEATDATAPHRADASEAARIARSGGLDAADLPASATSWPRPRVFAFASEWKDLLGDLGGRMPAGAASTNSACARQAISLLFEKHSPADLMVGFDIGLFKPADDPEDAEDKRSELAAIETIIDDARSRGASVAIYLEGPFGATGGTWERGEARRFIDAAIRAGLTTTAKAPKLTSAGNGNVKLSAPLKKLIESWNSGGHFWADTLTELRYFNARGFIAAEIDNLDAPFDEFSSSAFDRRVAGLSGRLGFYRTYADYFMKGEIPRLILKNIDAETFAEIGVKLGRFGLPDDPRRLPRAMFADFHICEADDLDADDRKAIAAASAKLGIETLFSLDTHHYRAFGEFGAAAAAGLAANPSPASGGLEAVTRALHSRPLSDPGATAQLQISPGIRLLCERIVNVYETGSVRGNYANISIFADGPHSVRQVTYGRAQTTEYGNLRKLVSMYASAGGTYSDQLRPYVDKIGIDPLVDNSAFKSLLRRAGREDPVMRTTQDVFFDDVYFQPALRWARAHGFTKPLSMLVIYDSFIHSGSIRAQLRARFPERTPAEGGSEREWIRQYVDVRHEWLRTHSNPELHPTVYRTRDLAREIARGNWDLALLPISANGTPVDDKPLAERQFEALDWQRIGDETAALEAAGYRWEGLSKDAFLVENRSQLRREIQSVDAKLTAIYGDQRIGLTEFDVWLMTYAEAGLSGGRVDPQHRHSEGERGLLPLPSNIHDWNGASAPAWNRPMPLEVNLHHFFLYLGHLINKKVAQTPRFALYRDLFRLDPFRSSPRRRANLLAGVVHGYFYSGTYSDRRVPFDHLIEGYAAGRRVDEIMRPTRYVHAGDPKLAGRANNLAAAERLLERAGAED